MSQNSEHGKNNNSKQQQYRDVTNNKEGNEHAQGGATTRARTTAPRQPQLQLKARIIAPYGAGVLGHTSFRVTSHLPYISTGIMDVKILRECLWVVGVLVQQVVASSGQLRKKNQKTKMNKRGTAGDADGRLLKRETAQRATREEEEGEWERGRKGNYMRK